VKPQDAARTANVPARFPPVAGRTLLGLLLMVPSDLPAARTLVVVAFQRWQQNRVDRWIERAVASGVPATTRGQIGLAPVAVVELPVMSSRWRPVRRVIDGGMTSGIRDPDVLARTITVYTDVGAFQRSLAIPNGDDVHALVVRRDGTVLARAHGDPDDTAWETVAEALLGD